MLYIKRVDMEKENFTPEMQCVNINKCFIQFPRCYDYSKSMKILIQINERKKYSSCFFMSNKIC